MTMNSLTSTFLLMSDYESAYDLATNVLEYSKSTSLLQHQSSPSNSSSMVVLTSQFHIGCIAYHRNHLDDATIHFKHCLFQRCSQYGDDDIFNLQIKTYMGHVLVAQLRYEEARVLYQECVDATKRYYTLYSDHIEVLKAMYHLATCYTLQGRCRCRCRGCLLCSLWY
jgi:tetratricopeptide (TPR) repeat protein